MVENYSSFVNERLGISDVVFRTAKFIYDKYNLSGFERNREYTNTTIMLDTSDMESPFNQLEICITFKNSDKSKNIHGMVGRIKENRFIIYIFPQSNNLARTLAHELNHVYQRFLKKRSYKTNKDIPSVLRKSEESPTLMSIYTQLIQHGVTSKEDFLYKLHKLPKYKNCLKIVDNKESTKNEKRVALKMIKKMHNMYDLFLNPTNENLEAPSDIKIDVEGKDYLVDRLIDNLSLIVKKRKLKSLRIKGIKGYINKSSFTGRGYTYETNLEVTLTNKDVIIGEYNSKNNNINIKINGELVYDIDHRNFDNEVLIEKIVGEYIKHLKNKKFTINEAKWEEGYSNWGEEAWWGDALRSKLKKSPEKDELDTEEKRDKKFNIVNYVERKTFGTSKKIELLKKMFIGKEITLQSLFTDEDDETSSYIDTIIVKDVFFKNDELYFIGMDDVKYLCDLREPYITIHDKVKVPKDPEEKTRWYSKGKLE